MSFDEIDFTSTPNFSYKEIVRENSECCSTTHQFACYKNEFNEVILISPYFNLQELIREKTEEEIDKEEDEEYPIYLIKLTKDNDNKDIKNKEDKNNPNIVQILKGHKARISIVRHFQNPYTKKNYLMSADQNSYVSIWCLSDNYSNIYGYNIQNNQKVDDLIISALMIFNEKNIIAFFGSSKLTQIDFNRRTLKDISLDDKSILYLCHWHNKLDNQHYIIECLDSSVIIFSLEHIRLYLNIKTCNYNLSCVVFQKHNIDHLAICSSLGQITIVNLINKKIEEPIVLQDCNLYTILRWNQHYLLVNDCLQKRILVIEIDEDYRLISHALCPEMNFDRFIAKVIHPQYGESILSIGCDYRIKLFSSRNIKIK